MKVVVVLTGQIRAGRETIELGTRSFAVEVPLEVADQIYRCLFTDLVSNLPKETITVQMELIGDQGERITDRRVSLDA